MPQLLVFAACEKAMNDKEDGSLSIISMWAGLNIQPKDTTLIEKDTVTDHKWASAVLWRQLPTDEGKTFEQRIELIRPDEKVLFESTSVFKMEHLTHSVIFRASGFPVGFSGTFRLRLCLREIAEQSDWQEISEYPIEITHLRAGGTDGDNK